MSSKIAVIINGESINYKDINRIYKEIKKSGDIIISKLYSKTEKLNLFKEAALDYSIKLVNINNDMDIIIDIMDLLYTKNVDTFYIVSNGGSYKEIINRLKENKKVLGISTEPTKKEYSELFNSFICLGNNNVNNNNNNIQKKLKTNKQPKLSLTKKEPVMVEVTDELTLDEEHKEIKAKDAKKNYRRKRRNNKKN